MAAKAGGAAGPLAAKKTTATVPIVFAVGSDPVQTGLVASLNRPGGNVTGVAFMSVETGTKRLELLRAFVPKLASIALLVNLSNPNAEPQRMDTEAAATALGLRVNILKASSEDDLEIAFATCAPERCWSAPTHFSSVSETA